MGSSVRTYKRICTLGVVFTLLCTELTSAATAKKLYSLYGQKLEVNYPDGVLDTIQRYNDAKKYEYMYAYVTASEYDDSIIDNRIKDCTTELKRLEKQLLAGVNLKLSEIYELENQYKTVKQQLDNAMQSKQSFPIETSRPSQSDTPSQDDYKQAMQAKKEFEAAMELGNIDNLTYPVNGTAIPVATKSKSLKLNTARGQEVVALFNGKVIKTTDNSITISHNNGIVTKYTGLGVVTALDGDTLSQGMPIGLTGQRLTVQLIMNKKKVNINKLFGEN